MLKKVQLHGINYSNKQKSNSCLKNNHIHGIREVRLKFG